MADRRRTTPRAALPAPTPAAQPNALTSAASILGQKVRKLPPPADWEGEAWAYYATVPECQFAVNWKAGAMSRVRLVAAVPGGPGDEPRPIDLDDPMDAAIPGAREAVDFVAQLAGGVRGQSALLKEFSVYLDVPGSGYLVGEPPPDPEDDPGQDPTARIGPQIGPSSTATPETITWHLLSNDEIRKAQRAKIEAGPDGKQIMRTEIRDGETGDWKLLPKTALIVRVWTPDPRQHWQATSPTRGALPVLRELDVLNKHIESSAISRLAGNGIFAIPSEASNPTDPRYPSGPDDPDPFMAMITDAMTTAIQDRDSAAAVAPIVIRMPGQFIKDLTHVTFSTPFDERVSELRVTAQARYATSTDLPTEIVSGLAGANHWTAWQIGESAIRIHVEPRMETICWALTEGYLQALLRSPSVKIDNPDLMVWFDTSELTARPDISDKTTELFKLMQVGPKAVLREAGLGEDDAPDDDELKRMMLIAALANHGELVGMVLHELGIPTGLPNKPLGGTTPGGEAPVGPQDAPADGPPAEPASPPDNAPALPAAGVLAKDDALLLVSDVLVWRALEKSGNRLLRQAGHRAAGAYAAEALAAADGVEPWRAHEVINACQVHGVTINGLLAGAWDRVPELAAALGIEPGPLTSVLHEYSAWLIVERRAHTLENLREALGG